MNNIGLCGSHRTGKTRLAKQLAQELNIPFAQTNVKEIIKEIGFSPERGMTFNARLMFQWEILDRFSKIWRSQPSPFITDRTPIDMIAYLFADISQQTVISIKNLDNYVLEALKTCNELFPVLLIIPPAIHKINPDISSEKDFNAAFMYKMHSLILGQCYSPNVSSHLFQLPFSATDLSERVALTLEAIRESSR